MASISQYGLQGRPRLLDRMNDAPPWWRRVDVVLIGSALAIALSGVLMVLSATRSGFGSAGYSGFAVRQGIWISLGLAVMTAFAAFDYRRIWKAVPWMYGGFLLVLLFVLSPLGSSSKGSQAWFQIAGFQFQPSEWAKIIVTIAVAAYCARQTTEFGSRHTATAVGLAALPMGLILLQPDLGTVLVFAAITFTLLLVTGAPARALVTLVVLGVLIATVAISAGVLKQYQLDRLGRFPRSQQQHRAVGLQPQPVENCYWFRRRDRQRALPGHPNQPSLRARATHRLHLYGGRRGARPDRLGHAARPVRHPDLANASGGQRRPRPVWQPDLRRCDRNVCLPNLRKRRHDNGHHAHYGHSTSAGQLRRVLDYRLFRRPRPYPERPIPLCGIDTGALRI